MDINKTAFAYAGNATSRLTIADIQYDRNYYRLYVLDEVKGVTIFSLNLQT